MKVSDRNSIYQKYGGRCAYCGTPIEFKNMQVDHLWPKNLAQLKPDEDNDREENLMPSCQPCNIHKHGMPLDRANYVAGGWRHVLGRQVSMLRKNAQFNRAVRFSQIVIEEKPIQFYFEYELFKEQGEVDG